ncbi:hypothetical protein ALI144C_04810 [Actinosynnema sp. ALI-1.44]|nr:hypothetical protein ALI144C_04810 [Actinosynnema sp. ALI-1.44]
MWMFSPRAALLVCQASTEVLDGDGVGVLGHLRFEGVVDAAEPGRADGARAVALELDGQRGELKRCCHGGGAFQAGLSGHPF